MAKNQTTRREAEQENESDWWSEYLRELDEIVVGVLPAESDAARRLAADEYPTWSQR